MNNAIRSTILILSYTTLLATSAFAQEADDEGVVEEVLVTATKRATTIKEVPFSINAQTQRDIQRSGATSLEELSRNVAGLAIQNLGPGQSQVGIRGISAGQIVRDQPGVKEQVGIYLDESVISLSLFTPDLDLYDLNRVETLRGPQGTLFGSGSVGGTIRYITNQPDPDQTEFSFEGNLHTLSHGETGGSGKAMANIPLADGQAALRVVGYVTQYAGYIDALGEGGKRTKDINDGTRSGGRIALRWQATDNVTITPRIIYQDINMDGNNRQEAFNLFANPFTTTRPPITFNEREQFLLLQEGFSDETLIADVTAEAALNSVDMTFVASYTNRDIIVSRDASALTGSVSVDVGFPEAGVLLPSNLIDTTSVESYTTELRFASNTDGPWQWLIGGFYANTDRVYAQRLPTPGYAGFLDAAVGAGTSAESANGFPNLDSPFNSDLPFNLEQFAFFGEVSYDVTDQLHLTAGGRYYNFDETRFITTGGFFGAGDDHTFDSTSSTGFTPRFMASYDVNEDITLNAQASRGFRLGGINDPLNAVLCTPEDRVIFGGFQDYDDEKLWNYEAGIKTQFGNGITFNAAYFYADISGLQVTLDAGSCSSRISFNVPDAHSAGVEFELKAQPNEYFEFSVAGTALSAEFDSTVRDAKGNILGGVENGNRLASVPEFQIAVSATYTFPGSLVADSDTYLSATYQHVGSRITQPTDQLAGAGNFASGLPFGGASGSEITALDLNLPSYDLVNVSLGLVKDAWEVVLYVNNLTDENANLSFDRERGGRARLGFRTNQPRTYGVTYRFNY